MGRRASFMFAFVQHAQASCAKIPRHRHIPKACADMSSSDSSSSSSSSSSSQKADAGMDAETDAEMKYTKQYFSPHYAISVPVSCRWLHSDFHTLRERQSESMPLETSHCATLGKPKASTYAPPPDTRRNSQHNIPPVLNPRSVYS